MATTSARLETARTFLAAFGDLSVTTHLSIRSDDCIQIFRPGSVGIPEPQDNATFASHLSHISEVMSGFPVTAREMIDSENEKAVTIWATSNAQFLPELKDQGLTAAEWTFQGEYIFVLHMDDSGRKIKRVLEFVDSKATDRLRALMARAKENRGKLPSAQK
jgi:hypothetical protein